MTLQRLTNTEEFNTRISSLSQELQQEATINLESAVVHAEESFKRILCSIYGYKLKNMNEADQNSEAIDLIEEDRKLVIQVTVSASRSKVEKTLSKPVMEKYANSGYRLKFMFIGTAKLPKPNKPYKNPFSILFNPKDDCLYCENLVASFSRLDIEEQEYALFILKQELGEEFLITEEILKQQFQKSKKLLGVRYSPNLSVSIDESDYLDAFINPTYVKKKVLEQLDSLVKAEIKARKHSLSISEQSTKDFLERLHNATEKARQELTTEAIRAIIKAANEIDYARSQNELDEKSERLLDSIANECRRLNRICLDFGFDYTEKRFILFTGNGGIGKSHFLADCCDRTISSGGAAFLLLGQSFATGQNPCEQVAQLISGKPNVKQCFSEINRFAKSRNTRAIIAIDALNEGIGKNYWIDHLPDLVEGLKPYENIVFLASVRTTYEKLVIPSDYFKSDESFERIELKGFRNSPDAVRLFCEFFEIESPAFPPYGEEYSNPLYLRILCEAIAKKGTGKFELNISFSEAISSCIDAVDERIKRQLQCITPISIVSKALEALVNTDSFSQLKPIPYEEAFDSVATTIGPIINSTTKILELLEAENLIRIDRYKSGAYLDFCYERFGDYIHASSVIASATDGKTSRNEAIRNSEEIHRVLSSDGTLGTAEALSILLSEQENIDSFELLNLNDETEEQLAFDLFIAAIPWNKRSSLSTAEESYIRERISSNPNRLIRLLVEMLDVAMSSSNAFNADLFNEIAVSLPPQQRDGILAWTFYESSSVLEMLDWLWENYEKVPLDCINQAIKLLPWLFASSSPEIRDKATKLLSCCLLRRPETSQSLSDKLGRFADDYIDERVIAAIYGAVSNAAGSLEAYVPACMSAYSFVYEGEQTNPNIMNRCYTDCMVDFMKLSGAIPKSNCKLCSSQGNSNWYENPVSNEEIDEYLERCEKEFGKESDEALNLWWIIHSMTTEYGRGTGCYGDFGRYVFGSVVRCWTNQFDSDQNLANLALKELLDNSYSDQWHLSFDRRVRHSEGYSNCKTERLSKKYQWISLHRLIGRLIDNFPPYEEIVTYDQEYLDYRHKLSIERLEAIQKGDYSQFSNDSEMNASDHILDVKRRYLEADEMFWELENLRDIDPTYLKTGVALQNAANQQLEELYGFSNDMSLEKRCEALKPLHECSVNKEEYVVLWALVNIKNPNEKTKEVHWQSFSNIIKKSNLETVLADRNSLQDSASHMPETFHVYCREKGSFFGSKLDEAFRKRDNGDNTPLMEPLSVGYLWEPVRDGSHSDNESISIQYPSNKLIERMNLVQSEIGVWKSGDEIVCFEERTEAGRRLLIRKDCLSSYLSNVDAIIGWNEYLETTGLNRKRMAAWLFYHQLESPISEYEVLKSETYTINARFFN